MCVCVCVCVCVQKDRSCSVEYCYNTRRLCQAVAHVSCIPESDIGWGGGGAVFIFIVVVLFSQVHSDFPLASWCKCD